MNACTIQFTATELAVTLVDGRKIATPLEWYPSLKSATPEQRANYEIMPMGIHWPDFDEDPSAAGESCGLDWVTRRTIPLNRSFAALSFSHQYRHFERPHMIQISEGPD